ncbi:hypothetical protein GGF46_000121 [Coemansia sp. RSA 552]|nr:hypothetical protein GGF46_000121 [Coemansia sp. RSA 552]
MADEEDYSALPLEQRLAHKKWKVRMNAYTELTKQLRQLDPVQDGAQFRAYESFLDKMVLDTNMAAQEAGVSAVAAFVENAPNPTRRREEIVSGIVAKCLSATKAGTRTGAKEVLLLLSEADTPAPVVTGLIEGFDAKQPKAITAAVAAVRDVVHAFGIKFINLKPLLKALSKPFAHRDNGVRSEAQHLTVELYRWMGQAILPSLQDLPPVLLKDLETQFEAAAKEPRPKQERLLRSQQEADEPAEDASARGADGGGGGDDADADGGDAVPAELDPWDLADPVDIATKLPDDYEANLESKKWKERKEVVEQLHVSLTKAIRLQMSPGTGDIIQGLGKKVADTNIIVATLAIQNLGLLASALRQPFAPYVQSTLPALIEKSKERKQTVVDAIRTTADAYFEATGRDLSTFGDHYFTGATHKNPQTRAESHHLLRRCFAVVATRPGKGDVKRYAEQLKSGFQDGDAGVREAAAECLGTLSKLVTAKVLDPFIEGIDEIKAKKISEYAEKATVKVKAAPKPRAAPPPAKGRPRPKGAPPARAAPPPAASSSSGPSDEGQSAGLSSNLPPALRKKLEASARAAAIKKAQREGRPIDDLLPAEPAPAAPAAPVPRPSAPKRQAPPPVRKPAAAGGSKPKAPRPGASKGAGEPIRMKFPNDESLDEKIAGALPGAVLEAFESAKWKDRMEAMDQLKEFLSDEAAGGAGVHPELVIRQLGRKPGWKESNFQVNSRAFQVIEWMASEKALDFNTGSAALCVPALVDKLGDIKLKGPAGAALVAIAERYSLEFLVGLMLEPIKSQKSPKVITDCLAWLNTQLLEFGITGLPLRTVISTVKEVGLQSSNAQARSKAVTLMGTLRRGVGPAVMDLMGDLNAQLVQLLETEFDKVGSQPMPEPTRTQGSIEGVQGGVVDDSGAGAAAGGGAEDPMDDLFPRQDLDEILPSNIIKQLSDANWKERKAGLEAIQGALESANHRILPNVSGDLYAALKGRLQDPNKNLITVALQLLGTLATDCGYVQVANVRIVAIGVIHCLADKKPQLRSAAIATMTAWAKANPMTVDQAVLPAIPNALGDSSPELRSSLLKWVYDTLHPRQSKGTMPDLSLLISPLFSCLQDRNVEVRKQANKVLGLTVACCGFETVYDACNLQLHGAAKNTVAPMVEEYRHTIGAAPAPAGPGAGPARRAGGPPASGRGRPGAPGHGPGNAAERAASPAPESVMTASELLGRGPSSAARPGADGPPAPGSAVGGSGVLRRPMAVRRPGGAPAAGLSGMRGARPGRGYPSSSEPSRPGSSLRSATPTQPSLASQLARMSDEELENVPPVLDNDQRAKDQRARRDMNANPHGVPRWSQLGDGRVRGDLERQLHDQFAAHINPLVVRQLFSTGHYKDRDYLGGLTTLEEVVSIQSLSEQRFRLPLYADSPEEDSLAGRYMANVDLLLKYISIRMYDGSTHTLLKCLDLLERLITLAEESQQNQQSNNRQASSWSDYEVQAVLPALISRLGDVKETVRARARRLLTQQITHLYPTTKLFTMLLEFGVTNRTNARVRQESLDCVCFLVRERTAGLGLSAVCAQPGRAVPIISQGIADRDSSVRAATLNVLVAVGEQLPGGADDLWRLCGRMAEKERTMLEEKLKRSTIGAGSGSQSGSESHTARPGSRIGMPQSMGARPRGSQYGAPSNAPPAGGLRSSGISRLPMARNGAGPAAGLGAGRLARPPASQPAPAPIAASSGAPRMSESTSYAPTSMGGGKPMFSLDFDNLNLPSYSSATTEHMGPNRGRELKAGLAGAPPPASEPQDHGAQAEFAHSGIGYNAGRSERLRSALSGLHGGSPRSSSGSPVMGGVSGVSRPMSMAYGSGMRRPADFVSMSDSEREQWIGATIADIRGDDARASEQAIERLKDLLSTVEQSADDMSIRHYSPALSYLRKNISDICLALAAQIRWAYTTTSTDPMTQSPFQTTLGRIRKSAVNLLLDVFGEKNLALWVPQAPLQDLIEELVQRLADPLLSPHSRARDEDMESVIPNSDQLFKAINHSMMRILDNADRTAVHVSLIHLLDRLARVAVPNPPQSNSDILRVDMGDIVMRCLWRISKHLADDLRAQFSDATQTGASTVPDNIAAPSLGNVSRNWAVRVDSILFSTHEFFSHIPNSEWRRREDKERWAFGDLPKRTVKTISHSFVLVLGSLVWQFAGPIVRDVMEGKPGMLPPPPPLPATADTESGRLQLDANPMVSRWAEDINTKLTRESEAWEYLVHAHREIVSGKPERPAAWQILTAYRASQTVVDEGNGSDGVASDTRSPVGLAMRPASMASPSCSPLQQPRALFQPSSPIGDRARSPSFTASSVPAPAASARPISTASSTGERLLALRERMQMRSQPAAAGGGGESQAPASSSVSPPISSVSPPISSYGFASAASKPGAAPASGTPNIPPLSSSRPSGRPADMATIRQRLDQMRAAHQKKQQHHQNY